MATKITLIYSFLLINGFLLANPPATFWSEDFSNGLPPGWTTDDLTGNEIVWEHCTNFLSCPPNGEIELIPNEWFRSESFEDGFPYLSPYGIGIIDQTHESVITSSTIDCSDKNEVFLSFSSFIISGESEPEESAILQVKGDNGVWTDFTIYPFFNDNDLQSGELYGFQSYNPHKSIIDISQVAANQSDVQIRWKWSWTGFEVYFWAIDDVELFEENPLYERTVWGSESGKGDFAGSLNDWSVIGGGPCLWKWNENGLMDTPDSNDEANYYVNSPSQLNGVAMIDGSACNFQPVFSELVSPTIDLTSIASGTLLDLVFNQSGALTNFPELSDPVTSVSISLDGGVSYGTPFDINKNKVFIKVFNEQVSIPLPEGVAGNAEIRCKFTFDGNVIFWAIDDVHIVERYERDLVVNNDYFLVAPNFSTPGAAVSPVTFAVEVMNKGSLVQDQSTVFIDVLKGKNTTPIFQDSIIVGMLEPGEIVDDLVFTNKFFPEKWNAKYLCRYRIETDEADEYLSNNDIYWNFHATDTVFSKTKGPSSINAGFFPTSSINYEIGNCFFVPPGANLRATGINFGYGNKALLDGSELKVRLYKWQKDNSWGDANQDTLINEDEFTRVALNIFYTAEDANDLDPLDKIYSVPISFESDTISIPLEDSTYYFVTVEYNDVETPNQRFPIAGSEEIDYTGMYLQSYLEEVPQYVSVLRSGDEEFFRINSWGLKRIPYVELTVERVITSADEIVENDIPFSVFPNPTSDLLNVEIGDTVDLGAEVEIEIIDVFGKLVRKVEVENKFVSHIPITLSDLSNGSYILRVVSDNRSGSRPFVVLNN